MILKNIRKLDETDYIKKAIRAHSDSTGPLVYLGNSDIVTYELDE